MSEIIASRAFAPLYIYLDTAFLLFFMLLLLWRREYTTVVVGLVMGVVYMIVDYGIFHLVCHSRSIEGGSLFWTLLWMSMSYGFTNFAWIWLWLKKDRHLVEWSTLILTWWLSCPLIVNTFNHSDAMIVIQRTTSSYHGYMAILLFAGYAGVIIYNLMHQKREERVPIFWILSIGILVQFGWEFGLLIGGIRSTGVVFGLDRLKTLLINSLLETNLGMPYAYFIFIAISSRFTEDFKRREKRLSINERIIENNGEKVL